MKFVDEQDRVLRTFHFVHDRLDSLFKLTAVLRSRDHHGKVQHNDPLVPQNFGDFAVDHHLRKTFDDRGLADTRFSQQYGIVFLSSTKNLNHALNLVRTPNDGVEFRLPGEFCQVTSEAVESGCLAFRGFPRSASLTTSRTLGRPFGTTFNTMPQQIQNFFADIFQFQTQVHQNLSGNPFLLADQPEQQMFRADIVVIEVSSLFLCIINNFFRSRSLRQLAHRDHIRSRLNNLFDFQTNLP